MYAREENSPKWSMVYFSGFDEHHFSLITNVCMEISMSQMLMFPKHITGPAHTHTNTLSQSDQAVEAYEALSATTA